MNERLINPWAPNFNYVIMIICLVVGEMASSSYASNSFEYYFLIQKVLPVSKSVYLLNCAF